MQILGMEFRSLYLQGRYSIDWAISLALEFMLSYWTSLNEVVIVLILCEWCMQTWISHRLGVVSLDRSRASGAKQPSSKRQWHLTNNRDEIWTHGLLCLTSSKPLQTLSLTLYLVTANRYHRLWCGWQEPESGHGSFSCNSLKAHYQQFYICIAL